jgi:prepilin-type N-terminal cleavage/methylation domain-containing protein
MSKAETHAKPVTSCLKRATAREARPGFTMIEMLVVIAIIGILASLILVLIPAVNERKFRAAAKAQVAAVAQAIQNYRAKKNYYPPDNPNNAAQPPLYYELTGAIYDRSKQEYTGIQDGVVIKAADMPGLFGVGGFLNSSPDSSLVENFYPELRPSQVETNGAAPVPNAKVLVAPVKSTNNAPFSVLYYNSSRPVHNPGGFDLWVTFLVGSKPVTVGNWKE